VGISCDIADLHRKTFVIATTEGELVTGLVPKARKVACVFFRRARPLAEAYEDAANDQIFLRV
jgi:hypothetical protein